MYKELLSYRKSIDELVAEGKDGYYDGVVEEHLEHIRFFQHERFVHLMVTLAFALMTIISIATAAMTQQVVFVVLTGLFLVLLVPYIVHYYHLENETQKLYPQYEELRVIEREISGESEQRA